MSGVTAQEVASAAAEILSEHDWMTPEKVSVRKVRDRLGRGSMTTVLEHLKAWKAAQQPPVRASEELYEQAATFVDQVFAAALEEAREELEDERRQNSDDLLDEANLLEQKFEQIKVTEAELEATRNHNRSLQDENDRLIEEANRLTALLDDEQKKAATLTARNLELERENAAAGKDEIAGLKMQLAAMTAKFEAADAAKSSLEDILKALRSGDES